jgi:hypothetical protein
MTCQKLQFYAQLLKQNVWKLSVGLLKSCPIAHFQIYVRNFQL